MSLDLELEECQTLSAYDRLLARKQRADIEALKEACDMADKRQAEHRAAINAPKPNQVSGPNGLLFGYWLGCVKRYFWAANYLAAIEYVRGLGLPSISVSAICTE